jgi:hypothetical protein
MPNSNIPNGQLSKVDIKDIQARLLVCEKDIFVCLTDLAKYKNKTRADKIINYWLKQPSTISYISTWEEMYNPDFQAQHFSQLLNKQQDQNSTVRISEFVRSSQAKSLFQIKGKSGGTFAHSDIAYFFTYWFNPKLMQKVVETVENYKSRLQLSFADWTIKRSLTKINYKQQTDAIKKHLIPENLTPAEIHDTYSDEAEILNKAIFNITSKEWEETNPDKSGNLRDYATMEQLIVLCNLETLNAQFIEEGRSREERVILLNTKAIEIMQSIVSSKTYKKVKSIYKYNGDRVNSHYRYS